MLSGDDAALLALLQTAARMSTADKVKKANRILRVLENISHENEENANYLIEHKDFLDVLQSLFMLLDTMVALNPTTDMSDKVTGT